jgi:hypothetical protein
MRQAFAHTALLALDGDEHAPGAAVTVELCGHWEHEPPCRVPHRTDVTEERDGLGVRVLFACPPDEEPATRAAVERALAGGALPVPAPAGTPPTRWQLLRSAPAEVADADSAVAARLVSLS